MTDPTPLSPAAQAVATAIKESCHFTCEDIWMLSREVIAAALRAAADQVVPESCFESDDAIRVALVAIAAELEGAQ